jgi:Zn-dependent protease
MSETLQLLPLWYLAFIISITFHEAAHAFVGTKLGDTTAKKVGQVTLNPLPHIKREIVGTVVVPLFSFFSSGWMIGWASAPYNINWAKSYPKKLAIISIAGPAANLLLVIIVLLIINIGYYFDIFYAPDTINFSYVTDSTLGGIFSKIGIFLSILFSLNIMLFVFNLLPLPILDGSKIPLLFIETDKTSRYIDFINDPRLLFPTILVAWFAFEYVHDPIRNIFLNMLYFGVSYG